jgi:hypothetical protein
LESGPLLATRQNYSNDEQSSSSRELTAIQLCSPSVYTSVMGKSQSKLSADQLAELQKATHFDKKELQQWYKGASFSGNLLA